jgi:AraC-like DNA-binding protein
VWRRLRKDAFFIEHMNSTPVDQMTSTSWANRVRQAPSDQPRTLAKSCSDRDSPSRLPLEGVIAFIEAHLGDELPLARLAALGGLSVWRFATVFRAFTGEPPQRYVLRRRIERAQVMLRDGVPPSRVALETGFYDQSHLYRHFKRLCGMTPGQYSELRQADARTPRDPA